MPLYDYNVSCIVARALAYDIFIHTQNEFTTPFLSRCPAFITIYGTRKQ